MKKQVINYNTAIADFLIPLGFSKRVGEDIYFHPVFPNEKFDLSASGNLPKSIMVNVLRISAEHGKKMKQEEIINTLGL